MYVQFMSYVYGVVFRGSVKLSEVTVVVLSSAKLCKSEFLRHMNKSFRNILNKMGSKKDTSGT